MTNVEAAITAVFLIVTMGALGVGFWVSFYQPPRHVFSVLPLPPAPPNHTASSYGEVPPGLTLYTLTFDDGDELEHFYESDAVARHLVKATGAVSAINAVTGENVILEPGQVAP